MVAVVGGSGPCDCMCMHCGQSCRAFLLTLQFTLSIDQMFHHGGMTGNSSLPPQNHLWTYCLFAWRFVRLHTLVWCDTRNDHQLCWCVWHLFFLYIPVKIRTVYLATVFAIHWPCFVNGLSMCDIINNQPVSCTLIF